MCCVCELSIRLCNFKRKRYFFHLQNDLPMQSATIAFAHCHHFYVIILLLLLCIVSYLSGWCCLLYKFWFGIEDKKNAKRANNAKRDQNCCLTIRSCQQWVCVRAIGWKKINFVQLLNASLGKPFKYRLLASSLSVHRWQAIVENEKNIRKPIRCEWFDLWHLTT